MKDNEQLAAELLLSDSDDDKEVDKSANFNARSNSRTALFDLNCSSLADDDELQASVAAVDHQALFMQSDAHDLTVEGDDEDMLDRGGELLDDIDYMGFDQSVLGEVQDPNSFNLDEDTQDTL